MSDLSGVRNKFEDLEVWNKAHQLTLKIYRITNKFPRYSLTPQGCQPNISRVVGVL